MPEVIKKRIRQIDLGGASMLVLVAVLTVLLGVLPLHHQSQANVARAATLQQQLQDCDKLEQTIARANIQLADTQKRLDTAEKRLPSQAQMAEFMQQLARVADDAGLQVDTITPHVVYEAGEYKAMPVEINGSGNFNNCYKFLQGLRHMNRLTRLDDLVLQADSTGKGSKVGSAQCTVRVMISTFMAR